MNEPRLEDFGLTDADYNLYESKKYSYRGGKIGFGFAILSWFALILFGIIKIKDMSIDAIILIPFSVILVGAISNFVYEQIVKLKDKNYRQYLKFEKQKKEYDAWWTKNQALYWQRLSGRKFEQELGYLYSQLGYKVRLTPYSDDGGIDLILEKNKIRTIVQCKAHNKPIGPAVVRELYGTLISSGADKAILATLQGVTSGARSFISGKPITVIAIDDIIRMRKQLDDKSNHNPNEM